MAVSVAFSVVAVVSLYVEVGFVVPPGSWDVSDEDRVRRRLQDGLAALPYEPWSVLQLTTEPELIR
jgi:predicted Co/Zn/Cd cation transporter (cation efflux family)